MQDRYNGRHATVDAGALAAYEQALAALLQHRPAAGAALERATSLDPDFVTAHALTGFAQLTLGRAELAPLAAAAAGRARAALRRRTGPTAAEHALVDALDAALSRRFLRAADRLEAQLADEPRNLLLLKLAHALRFMAGDGAGMLAATTAVVGAWEEGHEGAGYVFGCHAFALEEAGRYAEAERYGEAAVRLAPDDAWGLHALCHVDEMNGRVSAGIERLEATRETWSRCNNFQFHMAWHLALFHVEAGDAGRALALYDAEIRPQPTDDYRDVANAASLLWRLRLAGVAVGDRWSELARLARRRAGETTLMFASLHHMLSLAAAGDRSGMAEALASWEAHAAMQADDQAGVAGAVGLAVARVVAGLPAGVPLGTLVQDLPRLGGSAAQRDVFVQTLARAAAAAGDDEGLASVMALRRRLRGEDAFSRRMARPAVA